MRQSGGGEIDAALRPNKALPPTVLLHPPPSIAIENCNFTPAPRDCMRKQAVCLHHKERRDSQTVVLKNHPVILKK